MASGTTTASRLRVLTLNTWTESTDLHARLANAISGIHKLNPDIVFLQEAVTATVRSEVAAGLGDKYHIVSTNHSVPRFPPLAYLPTLAIGGLASAAVARYVPGASWLQAGIVGAAALLLTSPEAIFRTVRMVLLKNDTAERREGIEAAADLMAQTILVRKSEPGGKNEGSYSWDELRKIEVTPFPSSIRGYPIPQSLRDWPWYWVQHCVLRPGFFIVQCTNAKRPEINATLTGAHLVVSAPNSCVNPVRIEQVRYMLKHVDAVTPKSQGLAIVAGDYNAPDDSDEVVAMRTAGYTDVALSAKNEVVPHRRFYTWDAKNNHYTHPGEPDDRIDFIFVRGLSTRCVVERAARVFDGGDLPIVSDHFGIVTDVDVATS